MEDQLQSYRKRQRDRYEASKSIAEVAKHIEHPQAKPSVVFDSCESVGIDPDVLAELPPEIREEVIHHEKQKKQHERQKKARAIAKETVAEVKGARNHNGDHSLGSVIETVVRKGGGEASLLDLLDDDSDEAAPEEVPPPSKVPRLSLTKAGLSDSAAAALKSRTAPSTEFRLLSWNIDGLDQHSQGDPNDLPQRTAGVCEEICRCGASVVCLQEVVGPSLAVIRRLLGSLFHIFLPHGEACPYFCVILLQRGKMEPLQADASYEPFSNTTMGRGLLSIPVRVAGGVQAQIMVHTSHLESTKPCAAERQSQCVQSLKRLAVAASSAADNCPKMALLAGDLNLRDDEAKRSIGVAEEECSGTLFLDAWELCGSDASCRFTWNPNENTNGSMQGPAGTLPKCRFDRVLIAAGVGADKARSKARGRKVAVTAAAEEFAWRPKSFSLVGKQRGAAGRFLSDHWGVLVEFEARQTSS